MVSSNDLLLIQAIQHKEYQKLETLLNQGANPNTQDLEHTPVLIKAINTQDLEIVKILILKGADVNLSKNPPGLTPLMLAVATNQGHIVDLLLQYGAKVNQTNEDQTPL